VRLEHSDLLNGPHTLVIAPCKELRPFPFFCIASIVPVCGVVRCAKRFSFFLHLLTLCTYSRQNTPREELKIGLDNHKTNFFQIFKCRIIKLVLACHIF
jgi:hypothetical protein